MIKPYFMRHRNEPYSTIYTLPGFGKIEHFDSGRIIASFGEYKEWHGFPTVDEAKQWLIVEQVKARILP